MKDAPKRMNHGQGTTLRKRQADRKRYDGIGGHLRVDAVQQFLDSFACQCGHKHWRAAGTRTSPCAVRDRFSLFNRKPVHLIEYPQPGTAVDTQLAQNLVDFLVKLIVVWIGDV